MQDEDNRGASLMYKLNQLARNKFAVGLLIVSFFGVLIGAPMQTTNASTQEDFGMKSIKGSTKLGKSGLIQTVTQIINVALGLLGIVAVVIILWGGFKWMTAGGSEEKVSDARQIIFQGIIGLAIILSAFAITQFVLSNLSSATGTGNLTPNNP